MNSTASLRTADFYFQVWSSVKYRLDALQGENREIVLATFSRVAKDASIDLMEVEAIHDHVHMLLEVRDDQTLPVVMKRLKGASAREIFEQVPFLRLDMHSNSFWQRGYGSRLIAPSEIQMIRHYIKTQEERPLRH